MLIDGAGKRHPESQPRLRIDPFGNGPLRSIRQHGSRPVGFRGPTVGFVCSNQSYGPAHRSHSDHLPAGGQEIGFEETRQMPAILSQVLAGSSQATSAGCSHPGAAEGEIGHEGVEQGGGCVRRTMVSSAPLRCGIARGVGQCACSSLTSCSGSQCARCIWPYVA